MPCPQMLLLVGAEESVKGAKPMQVAADQIEGLSNLFGLERLNKRSRPRVASREVEWFNPQRAGRVVVVVLLSNRVGRVEDTSRVGVEPRIDLLRHRARHRTRDSADVDFGGLM